MAESYRCPLCSGSAWATADLARRTEAAVRAIVEGPKAAASGRRGWLLVPIDAIAELRGCLQAIDGRAPMQTTMTLGEET